MLRYALAETGKWGKVAKFAGIKPESPPRGQPAY
jgi:hypothetical protein